MATREAFLQAIVETPDDDAPRLVYADWLDDHDDPARAEFIRVQCALDELPADDWRRGPLEDRERELLDAHVEDWLAELPIALEFRDVRFCRGLVEWVALGTDDLLAHGDRLLRVTPIQKVRLEGLSGRVTEIAQVQALSRVRVLELGCNQLGPDDAVALVESPHLAHLESLDLRLNFLGDQGVRALSSGSLANLRTLKLGLNQMGSDGLQALLESSALPSLTELDLSNHAPPNAPMFCQSVSGFTMYWNPISNEFADLIAHSPSTARLTSLGLDSALYGHAVGVGDAGCTALAASPFVGKLTTLDLSGGDVTAEGIRVLTRPSTQARNLDNLRELTLHYNPLDEEAISLLATGPGLSRLRGLGVAGAELSDEGLERLVSSTHLSGLRTWILSECTGFGAPGVTALARSPHLAQLRVLALNCNPIGPSGAQALARATFAQSLTRLYLSDTSIGMEGACALAESTGLAGLLELDLSDNGITEAQAGKLRQRFGHRVTL